MVSLVKSDFEPVHSKLATTKRHNVYWQIVGQISNSAWIQSYNQAFTQVDRQVYNQIWRNIWTRTWNGIQNDI